MSFIHAQWHPHSSTLAWKIPWTEEPGRLQSTGSLESETTEQLHFDFSLSCIGEGNANPLQCSCLENPRDRGAWWAAVYGVAQSRTRLKQLSSSSRDLISTENFYSTLFNNLDGKRINKKYYSLYVYAVAESVNCTLWTRIKLQTT